MFVEIHVEINKFNILFFFFTGFISSFLAKHERFFLSISYNNNYQQQQQIHLFNFCFQLNSKRSINNRFSSRQQSYTVCSSIVSVQRARVSIFCKSNYFHPNSNEFQLRIRIQCFRFACDSSHQIGQFIQKYVLNVDSEHFLRLCIEEKNVKNANVRSNHEHSPLNRICMVTLVPAISMLAFIFALHLRSHFGRTWGTSIVRLSPVEVRTRDVYIVE